MHTLRLQGTYPAIVTPFTADSSAVDEKSYDKLFAWLLDAGVEGFVVGGSTGESVTLTERELVQLVERSVEQASGRTIIAGVNSSSTAEGCRMAGILREAGAHTLLVTAPPYNKPGQAGLVRHFAAIAERFGSPVVAYNIPGRTGVKINPETIAHLHREQLICAVKDSTGLIGEVLEVRALCGDDLAILSGEDALTLPILASGGCGVISASGNLIPRTMSSMVNCWLRGDAQGALQHQLNALPVVRALFLESNPIPVKCALKQRGLIASDALRLPLLDAAETTRKELLNIDLPAVEKLPR